MTTLIRVLTIGFASLVFSAWVHAVPMNFVEGTHYFPTAQKIPTMGTDKVEVVEMFSYTCPHCFKLEPEVDAWLKTSPENVTFIRVPAVFRDSWKELAKVYYAAEATGDLEVLHPKIFHAIHVDHRKLYTEDDLLDFVAEQGIDRDNFAKTMKSFAVTNKVKKAVMMSQASGITGVPAMIVNGEYRTDASTAGGSKQLFEVVDYLAEQAK